MELRFPAWPEDFEELNDLLVLNSNKEINTSLRESLCCLFVTSGLEYGWFGCKLNLDARTAEVQDRSPSSSVSCPWRRPIAHSMENM